MIGQPHAPGHPLDTPATRATDLARRLLAASDNELVAILAAADQADIAMHQPGGLADGGPVRRAVPGTVEIVLLGALGCRYGMLAGGAGGYLLRTPATTVLVDPGPAAHAMLAGLNGSLFSWAELDAIACTHFHPDHYAGVIPCLEAMASHAAAGERTMLAANPTAAARFAAFSPYHVGGMADLVSLAHPATDGHGEPSVKIGDLTIHAAPARHTEEAGLHSSAIGLAFDTPAGGIWHTSDTTLADGILDAVADLLADITLVIAHADASNITVGPGRAAVCHLQTRDVLPIASVLRPRHMLIQHYDAAYSAPDYRIAQAVWLQRQLDGQRMPTRMLPGASGLRIIINRSAICDWDICLDSSSAEAVSSYLRSALSDTQNPLVAALRGQNSSRYREEGMWEQVGRLHSYHGDVPAEIRLLKLTEEVGEAAEALIGMQGLNSRKGTCRTRDDLLAELADVIITAAVAMSGIAGDVDEARSHLERRLAVVSERAGL